MSVSDINPDLWFLVGNNSRDIDVLPLVQYNPSFTHFFDIADNLYGKRVKTILWQVVQAPCFHVSIFQSVSKHVQTSADNTSIKVK